MISRVIFAVNAFMGVDHQHTSHAEKLASAVGGFCGIVAVFAVTRAILPPAAVVWIVASMGASAVLLFAVPHGKLSQPWALLGGHFFSAVIGVTCQRWISDPVIAAGVAVGLANGTMYYMRCIHPPGGASALLAVIGGPAIHALGYGYVFSLVMPNALIILAVAIAFNALFHWRRYPMALMEWRAGPPVKAKTDELKEADIAYALEKMDLLVDVTPEDLQQIYKLAREHARPIGFDPASIKLGHYYSNGAYGREWSVRQVVDMPEQSDAEVKLIYKVIAGKERRESGVCTREEFARWVRHEVYRNETTWQRV